MWVHLVLPASVLSPPGTLHLESAAVICLNCDHHRVRGLSFSLVFPSGGRFIGQFHPIFERSDPLGIPNGNIISTGVSRSWHIIRILDGGETSPIGASSYSDAQWLRNISYWDVLSFGCISHWSVTAGFWSAVPGPNQVETNRLPREGLGMAPRVIVIVGWYVYLLDSHL